MAFVCVMYVLCYHIFLLIPMLVNTKSERFGGGGGWGGGSGVCAKTIIKDKIENFFFPGKILMAMVPIISFIVTSII